MIEKVIAHIEKRVALTDAEKTILRDELLVKHFKKGEFLLSEGQRCHADYYVVKGCLRQYDINSDGRPQIVQFALADWWISDLASMFSGHPSTYFIDCLENTIVIPFAKDHLDSLFVRIPVLERFFRLNLQQSFIALQKRILYAQRTADERYSYFQQHHGHFEQQIPQHQIAYYLGITPESLSRIRRLKSK